MQFKSAHFPLPIFAVATTLAAWNFLPPGIALVSALLMSWSIASLHKRFFSLSTQPAAISLRAAVPSPQSTRRF